MCDVQIALLFKIVEQIYKSSKSDHVSCFPSVHRYWLRSRGFPSLSGLLLVHLSLLLLQYWEK